MVTTTMRLHTGLLLLFSTFLVFIHQSRSQTDYSHCYIFGSQHVLTFDRQIIDFSSDCAFSAAYTCPPSALVLAQFDITIDNEPVASVSQLRCAEVVYSSYVVRLCRDQTATVDGKIVNSMLTSNGELMVYPGTMGKELALHIPGSNETVQVVVSPAGSLRISLPSSYASQLCGLCGNYDNDDNNDLVLADGTDVGLLSAPERGARIAGSHLVIDETRIGCQSTSDVTPFYPSQCAGSSPDVENDLLSPLYCGVYDADSGAAFASCVSADAGMAAAFNSLCEFDFCENYVSTDLGVDIASGCFVDGTCAYDPDVAKQAVNAVAEVFVDQCRLQGQDLSNWRLEYDAELSCPSSDLSYTFSGPKCPQVCGLPESRCGETNEDGCACASGLYRSVDSCVSGSECGCPDPSDGSYYPAGSWWLDSLCSTNFTCQGADTLTLSQVVCSPFATCSSDPQTSYVCVCNTGFVGDGLTCTRNCTAGQQPTSTQATCQDCPIGFYQPLPGQTSCLPCEQGNITDTTGSTSQSDCHGIVMVPDSTVPTNVECVNDIYDQSYKRNVPSSVLPDGVPFGDKYHRSLYVSTNGLVSFGQPFVGRDPVSLNTSQFVDTFTQSIAAAYWFRQDLRRSDPANLAETKLCISSYNKIDADPAAAEDSATQFGRIQILLQSSERLVGVDFEPVYALVATWHKSIAYPYIWYDDETTGYQEYATYQCIIVSDGSTTYLVYVYPTGEEYTRLRLLNEFRNIYMGYNTQDGINYFSFYLSTTNEVVSLDSQPSNTDTIGRWVFQVADIAENDVEAAQTCIAWYGKQQQTFFGIDPSISDPCPCYRTEALIDERYFYDYVTDCASKQTPNSYQFYQVCCYDFANGSLLTDPVQSGFPSLYQPIISPLDYNILEQAVREDCCIRSDHCTEYRTYRPAASCSNYVAPDISSGFGDPHILTLDGYLYTYNPIGEFWMIKTSDSRFSMQARMVQSIDDDNQPILATQFQAFAMQSNINGVKSERIHVEINNNRTDFIVYRDSTPMTAFLDSSVENALVTFNGGVVKKFNSSVTVSFAAGYVFRFSLRLTILSVQSLVPRDDQGLISGLAGRYDGDSSNDMVNSTGHVVCSPSACTSQQIYNLFGESWRITNEESLFWYRFGWDTRTYTDLSFEPIFDVSTNSDLAQSCNFELTCIFDATLTNSSDIGVYTSLVQNEAYDKRDIFVNQVPFIMGETQIRAQINQTVTMTYIYGDNDGDDVELMIKELPPSAEEMSFPGYNWTITWTPADFSTVSLKLFVKEMNTVDREPAVSADLNVAFYISPLCLNGGTANYSLLASDGVITPLFFKASCECDVGWEGEDCSQDINGCADHPCYEAECIDIPGAEVVDAQYYCDTAECPVGFGRTASMNSSFDECFDIDECVVDRPCSLDICVNTLGSFYCNCELGYAKEPSTENCVDIDECSLNTDACSDICINTNGSYVCDCFPGSSLQADNATCMVTNTDDNQLCGGTFNCSYACIDDGNGMRVCTCPRNQILSNDNSTCQDFDECLGSQTNGCDTSTGAQCDNIENGGYRCVCGTGYVLSSDGLSCEACPASTYGLDCSESCACGERAPRCDNVIGCIDCNPGYAGLQCLDNINECNATESPCPDNSQCQDTVGSYSCLCNSGYTLVTSASSTVCQNIDECSSSQPCSDSADCTDTDGSYVCSCRAGFTGDGFICSNINECATSSPCVALAKCEDTVGSYGCTCLSGYHGDGRTGSTGCTDTNECLDAVAACSSNADCINLPGTYTCQCQEFYTGDGFNSCVDIDECATQNDTCGTLDNGVISCVNTEPSYECQRKCNSGYMLGETTPGIFICFDEDECLFPNLCAGTNVQCVNTEGSYECVCNEFYEKQGDVCVDINECLASSLCNGDRQFCENAQPGFDCSCFIGYSGDNCTDINDDSAGFLVDQTFDLPYDDAWAGDSFNRFVDRFKETMADLYGTIGNGYQGVNVLSVVQDEDGNTKVSYEVVYRDSLPESVEHQTLYRLISNNLQLTFNGSSIMDLGNITFDSTAYTCDNISCLNNFTCEVMITTGYSYCDCSTEFTGYNCAEVAGVETVTEGIDNLLPLWISVGVAALLLLVGLFTCCSLFIVSYRRRRRDRDRQIHRHPRIPVMVSRGPAIFNPASRMPREAYNYQFPRGSVRSSDSGSSVSTPSSGSSGSRRLGDIGRVGVSVPFAPKWPRAYYSQLGDLTDN